MYNILRGVIAVAVVLVVGLLIFQTSLVMDAKNRGEKVYHIEVNSFNGAETYSTTNYTKDKETGCITFKDLVGIKRVVCNNYTITEY